METNDPTIYNVAKVAGVSISTVSRVLNAPHQVSESTRKKVLNAIEQLNFVPKAEASARARKQFGRIGILTPSLTIPSFVERIGGVAQALYGTEYELIVYSARNLTQVQHHLDLFAVSRRIDGLIINSLPIDEDSLSRVIANNIQVVSIEVPNLLCCNITVDNVSGGQLAAQYLLKKGHRRCAYIGEPLEVSLETGNCEKRLRGFREGLLQAGIDLPEEYIQLFPLSMENVIEHTNILLDLPSPSTAIFTYSDMYAIGVLKAARARKIQVPEELAVIGFDNVDAADFVELTTVDQHLEESGRLAVEVLLSRIARKNQPVQNVELQINIKERNTA